MSSRYITTPGMVKDGVHDLLEAAGGGAEAELRPKGMQV